MVCSLVSIILGSSQLGKQLKQDKTLEYWSRGMLNFDFFRKRSGNRFSTKFCVWFFKKNISHAIFY